MQTEPSKQARLGFISGVVPKAKAASFERILFRATRGNMFLKQAPVEDSVIDPATGEKVGGGCEAWVGAGSCRNVLVYWYLPDDEIDHTVYVLGLVVGYVLKRPGALCR